MIIFVSPPYLILFLSLLISFLIFLLSPLSTPLLLGYRLPDYRKTESGHVLKMSNKKNSGNMFLLVFALSYLEVCSMMIVNQDERVCLVSAYWMLHYLQFLLNRTFFLYITEFAAISLQNFWNVTAML